MEEDDFLVEAAHWSGYYDRVHEIIGQVTSANIADAPPQEVMDNPQAFKNWVEQCKKVHAARQNY